MDYLANNERKRQLLENRLGGNIHASPPANTVRSERNLNGIGSKERGFTNTTPPTGEPSTRTGSGSSRKAQSSNDASNPDSAGSSNHSQPTCVDPSSVISPREVIHIDSSKSNASRSRSNMIKENIPNYATNSTVLPRSMIGKRSFDLQDESNQTTADDVPPEKHPRQLQSATGSPPLQIVETTGSRGNAGGTMRNIKSYFHSSGGGSGNNHSSSMIVLNEMNGEVAGNCSNNNFSNFNVEAVTSVAAASNTLSVGGGYSLSKSRSLEAQTSNSGPTTSSGRSSVKEGTKIDNDGSSKVHTDQHSLLLQQQQNTIIELRKQLEQQRIEKEAAEVRLQRQEVEVRQLQDQCKRFEERSMKLTKALEQVHRLRAQQEFRTRRDKLALDCVRLGKIVPMRTGPTSISDVWEEGYLSKELSKRSERLAERKEELEQRRKKLQSLRRAANKKSIPTNPMIDLIADSTIDGSGTAADLSLYSYESEMDLATEAEVIRAHFEQLKRDESALAEERKLFEGEKAVHQKELKRCQCEERSRFYKELPVLNNRYLLQLMLGRGGFSEVWKALDLHELREVAVKVHQLNPTWSEDRKQSYIKHVTREYTIHRDMRHPRVVQLFDVFEIDVNSFATVLEFCTGIDLDEKLKRQKTLPEKDARAIFMQIVTGLKYLNCPLAYVNTNEDGNDADGSLRSNGRKSPNSQKRLSIIHFDLKPANILFDETGDVKITDFGLSKIIDDTNEGTSMELTSQGAGTYWYLPPECFAKGPEAPKISSKVDVWSAGIIFYQMLYGSRPFGEGQSQEKVWSEGLIYRANEVEFPPNDAKNSTPKVSEEAKDIIRACLTRDQRLRPDILAISKHPYLSR